MTKYWPPPFFHPNFLLPKWLCTSTYTDSPYRKSQKSTLNRKTIAFRFENWIKLTPWLWWLSYSSLNLNCELDWQKMMSYSTNKSNVFKVFEVSTQKGKKVDEPNYLKSNRIFQTNKLWWDEMGSRDDRSGERLVLPGRLGQTFILFLVNQKVYDIRTVKEELSLASWLKC